LPSRNLQANTDIAVFTTHFEWPNSCHLVPPGKIVTITFWARTTQFFGSN
jgi:hypothetical protein